jgi:hypothetical protein
MFFSFLLNKFSVERKKKTICNYQNTMIHLNRLSNQKASGQGSVKVFDKKFYTLKSKMITSKNFYQN